MKQAENASNRELPPQSLKESEERLRLALEAADIGIWDWNLKTGLVTWSDNMERLFAIPHGAFDGTYDGFLNLVHPEDRERIDRELKKAVKNHSSYDEEYRVIGPKKKIRWMRIRGNVYLDEAGAARRLMGSIHDKTERKLSLEALKNAHNMLENRVRERTKELSEANEKLRSEINEREKLQKEIMEISEREQQRIGRDLHDSLSQQIGGIIFMSQVVKDKLARNDRPESEDMEKIIGHLNSALKHTRDLSRGLFPVLEKGGLNMALRELALSMEDMFDIKIVFKCDEEVCITQKESAIHILRIVQEAINNAIKHGRATTVSICLKNVNKRLLLEIEDNGAGFPQKPNKKGMGLDIMKYRATMIGASLEIHSVKGAGTVIRCRMKKTGRLPHDRGE